MIMTNQHMLETKKNGTDNESENNKSSATENHTSGLDESKESHVAKTARRCTAEEAKGKKEILRTTQHQIGKNRTLIV